MSYDPRRALELELEAQNLENDLEKLAAELEELAARTRQEVDSSWQKLKEQIEADQRQPGEKP